MVKSGLGSTGTALQTLFRKFAAATAELGRLNAVLYAAGRLLSRLSRELRLHRYYIVAQPVADRPLLPARRGSSFEVVQIGTGHPGFAGLPLTEDVIAYRFAQNAVCLGAFRGGVIHGCLWLCFGPYDEDEVRCRFVREPEESTAWDFDVYVCPESRGGFVFARLWDEANAFLRARGIAWSISRISAFNPSSLASHVALGAKRTATVTYLKLWRWQIMVTDMPPYVHLSTNAGSVPRLRVTPPRGQGR